MNQRGLAIADLVPDLEHRSDHLLGWDAIDGLRIRAHELLATAGREYAYGPAAGLPDSKIGTFTEDLYDEAKKKGWIVISMNRDWKRVFSFEP